ncbi:hypothetical protein BpHYR1_024394 [Brachionus plicatilis]|uniref:Uncharacterized protein n=1 Tax=Brachionus plicatilis TaxID=10195 RepID=A0A3M7QT07_BRAPC|nr:hypothetical protein BpHYR1_024394 [Brachionus plicatilis]
MHYLICLMLCIGPECDIATSLSISLETFKLRWSINTCSYTSNERDRIDGPKGTNRFGKDFLTLKITFFHLFKLTGDPAPFFELVKLAAWTWYMPGCAFSLGFRIFLIFRDDARIMYQLYEVPCVKRSIKSCHIANRKYFVIMNEKHQN